MHTRSCLFLTKIYLFLSNKKKQRSFLTFLFSTCVHNQNQPGAYQKNFSSVFKRTLKEMLRSLNSSKLVKFSRYYSSSRVVSKMLAQNTWLCMKTLPEQGIRKNIIDKMWEIDRSEFLPDEMKENAYMDIPLPIGHGQTCSQPSLVALMAQEAEIKNTDTVLEIGTGCGYNAAILSKCAKKVYSTEIIPELYEISKNNLQRLGFTNVEVTQSDGGFGLSEHAPYDVIMLTASVQNDIPKSLYEQLKIGGRMILPKLDRTVGHDRLIKITKTAENEYYQGHILDVRFVPLTGESSK